MKKSNTKYGVLNLPAGIAICTMENGGDKDGKAIYRFSDTGKRTTSDTHTLISNETVMKDIYGDDWAHIKKGWVKAGDKITWYDTYKEATAALSKKKTWRRTILRIAPFVILAAVIGYFIYKRYRNAGFTAQSAASPAIDTALEPVVEPVNTVIPDEVPMD